ncbi:MAG TPA: endonuclease III [Anaerolineales bacterium]|nr:endonuclease III [Anaerolineales bacterium]
MNPRKCALEVHRRLLEIYGEPTWRNPLPVLDELVSTILSQNTNDTNRDRAFTQLKERFKNWEKVRDADEAEIISAIRSAGLANQKGPRIQRILHEITTERGSLEVDFLKDLPDEEAWNWLKKFKGVGPKTASIVLLFSLGKPAFPVDTHIYRVMGRVGLRPEQMNAEKAHRYLAEIFPPEAYAAAHLNIIRLGRELCHPRHPECVKCVLNSICDYYQKSQITL